MRIHRIVLVCVSLLTIGPATLTAQQTVPPWRSRGIDGRDDAGWSDRGLDPRGSGLGVVQVAVFDLGSARESVRELAAPATEPREDHAPADTDGRNGGALAAL